MGITICAKDYCNSSSPEKFLPQSFKNRMNDSNILTRKKATVLLGSVNYLDSINEESTRVSVNKNKILLPQLDSRNITPQAKKTTFIGSNNLKIMPTTARAKKIFVHKPINRTSSPIHEKESTSSNMMIATKSSTVSNSSKVQEKLSVTTNKPSLDLKISSERKFKKAPMIVSSPQLSELKDMHNMLQKSSYVPKERYISRKPTLEAIKDAIEKEKNKNAVDKNEGTSSIMFSVPTSDASTNTIRSNKKKKGVKKNRPTTTNNTKNAVKKKTPTKTVAQAGKVVKSQSGAASKAGGSRVVADVPKRLGKSDSKKVKLPAGVSVGIQYSVDKTV